MALAACGEAADEEVAATSIGSVSSTPPASASGSTTSVAPSSPGTTTSPADGLTGFGATREAWDSAHQQAPGFSPGSSYLPLIGGQPKYSAVLGDPGERILSYTLSFPEGTPLELAKAQVLAEFPSGAYFDIVDDEESRCLLMDIRSEEVEAVLDSARPMVGLFSWPDLDTPFMENDVRSAIFTLAFPDETSDLGMC